MEALRVGAENPQWSCDPRSTHSCETVNVLSWAPQHRQVTVQNPWTTVCFLRETLLTFGTSAICGVASDSRFSFIAWARPVAPRTRANTETGHLQCAVAGASKHFAVSRDTSQIDVAHSMWELGEPSSRAPTSEIERREHIPRGSKYGDGKSSWSRSAGRQSVSRGM